MLLIGFGIKIPLVPLHTWLPDAYVEASHQWRFSWWRTGKTRNLWLGTIRFGCFGNLGAPGLAILGAISAVYGALTAIAQKISAHGCL